MDITAVDRSATLGDSLLHRASPASKLIGALCLIATAIVTRNPLILIAADLALIGAAFAQHLPVRSMLPLILYPAIFASIFAFAAASGPVSGALIILKAITAALAMILVIFTTPYPQVFAPIQRITPVVVGDALFLTYRSLFIVADKFSELMLAIKLRAGISSRQPIRSARATTQALGGLLLYTFDLSQRDYDILRLRGYEGRLRVTPQHSSARGMDITIIAFGTITLVIAIVFRVLPLFGYSWIPACFGLMALVAGLLIGRSTR